MPPPVPPSIDISVGPYRVHVAPDGITVAAASGTDECCTNDHSKGQDDVPRRGRPVTNGKAAVNRILVTAGEPLGPAEVHRRMPAELDASPSAVKNWLAELVADHIAAHIPGGKYTALGQIILPALFAF